MTRLISLVLEGLFYIAYAALWFCSLYFLGFDFSISAKSLLLTPVVRVVAAICFKSSANEALSRGLQEAMLLPTDLLAVKNFCQQCAAGRVERQERFLQFCQGLQVAAAWVLQYGCCSNLFQTVVVVPLMFYNRLATAPLRLWEVLCIFALTQFYLVCTNVSFHRFFAHNAFHASRGMQFVLAITGSLGAQRGALWWGGIHRAHHQHCDTESDLHSPHQGGFFWAHCGWLMERNSFNIPMHNVQHLRSNYELWLYEPWAQVVAASANMMFAALLGLHSIDASMALSLSLHLEFCINSFCHLTEKNSKDECTAMDIPILGLLNGGEGYHGGHHEKPWCARHGWKYPDWLDLSYSFIVALEAFGVATNVQHPGQPDTRNARNVDVIPADRFATNNVDVDAEKADTKKRKTPQAY